MASPQSVVSPLKSFPAAEAEKQNSDFFIQKSATLTTPTKIQRNEAGLDSFKDFFGVLEVYIHQARDIHNICIYQKQDVYAKICLTSDPEDTVSTQIIHGGGRNPVFNENLRLNVGTVETSLKCEIWMLSRVRNYLKDQLLGFALLPLSEVIANNRRLEKECALSSTDLFHSPAGFVQLTLAFNGASSGIFSIPPLPRPLATDAAAELPETLSSDFDKIEFPDPKIANENQMMVSEYFNNLDSQSSESLVSSETENHPISDANAHAIDSFSGAPAESDPVARQNSPLSSNSSSSQPVFSQTVSDAPVDSKTENQREKKEEKNAPEEREGERETDSSGGVASEKIAKPVIPVNVEPEKTVVQQEIVDMYMKSMQQFTESLAKMKLPLDIDNSSPTSENSSSEQKSKPSKNAGSRVFYGSRAFF